MLETVHVGSQSIDRYEASVGAELVAQLQTLAAPLRGARILHLNATPYGGGVAELLRSEVPLLRDLGLAADWKIIAGNDAFFAVTKIGIFVPSLPEAKSCFVSYAVLSTGSFATSNGDWVRFSRS